MGHNVGLIQKRKTTIKKSTFTLAYRLPALSHHRGAKIKGAIDFKTISQFWRGGSAWR